MAQVTEEPSGLRVAVRQIRAARRAKSEQAKPLSHAHRLRGKSFALTNQPAKLLLWESSQFPSSCAKLTPSGCRHERRFCHTCNKKCPVLANSRY
jgi:hypothetical protein